MKRLLKSLIYYIIFIVLLSFVVSLLNLVGVDSTVTNLILFVFNVIAFFLYGFKNGVVAPKKGYLEGLKIGFILLAILFVINIIVARKFFSVAMIVYYLVLVLASVLGGMVGISKKKEEN